MSWQGYDLQLTAYAGRDWRANFFPVGIAHSIVGGSAWEPTPWRAVQRAGCEADVSVMRRADRSVTADPPTVITASTVVRT
jgi:hypothetical protein